MKAYIRLHLHNDSHEWYSWFQTNDKPIAHQIQEAIESIITLGGSLANTRLISWGERTKAYTSYEGGIFRRTGCDCYINAGEELELNWAGKFIGVSLDGRIVAYRSELNDNTVLVRAHQVLFGEAVKGQSGIFFLAERNEEMSFIPCANFRKQIQDQVEGRVIEDFAQYNMDLAVQSIRNSTGLNFFNIVSHDVRKNQSSSPHHKTDYEFCAKINDVFPVLVKASWQKTFYRPPHCLLNKFLTKVDEEVILFEWKISIVLI